MIDAVPMLALRVALAALFAAAAAHKLRDLDGFQRTIASYELLPAVLTGPAGRLVALLEILTAATLLLDPWTAVGAVLAVGLLAVYSVAIAVNLARGRRDLDCGCLGPAQRQPISIWLLVRNAVAIAGSALTLLPVTSRPFTGIDLVTLIGTTLGLTLVWSAATGLMATWPRHRLARTVR